MPKLNNEQKAFIVKELACFSSPAEVKEAASQRYGIELSRQQISMYDPENRCGNSQISLKWKDLFYQRRERFINNLDGLALSHKAVRVRKLDEVYNQIKVKFDRALDKDNYIVYLQLSKQMQSILEQIAKEVGDVFTNKHLIRDESKRVDQIAYAEQVAIVNQYYGLRDVRKEHDPHDTTSRLNDTKDFDLPIN